MQASALPYISGLQIVVRDYTPPWKLYVNGEVITSSDSPIFLYPLPVTKGLWGITIEVEDASGTRVKAFPGNLSLTPYELGFLTTLLQKQESIIRHHGGFAVRVFKRRRNGEACPRCLGQTIPEPLLEDFEEFQTKQALQVDPNCPVCLGTGYKGGYYKPIETWANYYQPQRVQADVFDTIRFEQTVLVMGNYPLLERDDIIVVPTLGKVFRVASVQTSEYKGVVTAQLVQTQSVEPGSVLYHLAGLQYLDLSDTLGQIFADNLV